MRAAFMTVFWGLVIIAVDIKINEIDWLLPDIVGYILVWTALTSLASVNAQFALARPFVVLSALYWTVSLFVPIREPFATLIGQTLELAILWFVCTGILQLALERSNFELARSATTRRNWMTGVALVDMTAVVIAVVAPVMVVVAIVPLAIVTLTASLFVLLLIRRASVEIV